MQWRGFTFITLTSGHLSGLQLGPWFIKCLCVCLPSLFQGKTVCNPRENSQGRGVEHAAESQNALSPGKLLSLSEQLPRGASIPFIRSPSGWAESCRAGGTGLQGDPPWGSPRAHSAEGRAVIFMGATKTTAGVRGLKIIERFSGKVLFFRSDLHIYPLSLHTLWLSQTRGLPVTASSLPMKCPVPNAASSLVSIPVKPCQLSFLRSSVLTSNPPSSVFVKL